MEEPITLCTCEDIIVLLLHQLSSCQTMRFALTDSTRYTFIHARIGQHLTDLAQGRLLSDGGRGCSSLASALRRRQQSPIQKPIQYYHVHRLFVPHTDAIELLKTRPPPPITKEIPWLRIYIYLLYHRSRTFTLRYTYTSFSMCYLSFRRVNDHSVYQLMSPESPEPVAVAVMEENGQCHCYRSLRDLPEEYSRENKCVYHLAERYHDEYKMRQQYLHWHIWLTPVTTPTAVKKTS